MSTLTQLYNALPIVEDADARFQDREALFEKLAPLLAQYGNQFGICLVHAHCSIDEGEKMIAKEYVSEPLRDTPCYPERWLASGEAYEFNINPTQSPPQDYWMHSVPLSAAWKPLGCTMSGRKSTAFSSREPREGRMLRS
ncbi:hypothetical protein CERSUDRAFT_122837 [Gelatoporia subvermispora B]|uniref:Uncharacterized protein n=1 Tax=Ceriporiopsis subvermispora (strain B) TaxID=914234 RepID=M2PNN1_CERS8|nr:hypothetical protein CERSUDRAFT_122837 [Gelatoporia subvermispora B]